MPQALGLVETKGLVGAIVAADAMLKAANVSLIGKEKVTPALITIKIAGETAAVKSAIEAGAAAAQRVGQLISIHLIPNPDLQLGIFFPEIITQVGEVPLSKDNLNSTEVKEETPKAVKQKKEPSLNTEKVESPVIPKEVSSPEEPIKPSLRHASLFDEAIEAPIDHAASTFERLKAEALHDLESEAPATEIKNDEITPELETRYDFDNSSFSLEDLESFNVHQLRKIARGVEVFPIHGREISRANRDTLLAHFKSLKK